MMDQTALTEAMDVLCPMHLILGPTGHVVHTGPTLRKLRPDRPMIGRRFLEIFDLKRPRAVNTIDGLRATAGTKLHLQLRDTPKTEVKGLLVAGLEEGQSIVNLSFGISVVDAVSDYALSSSDFAATDLTIEMLYLVEAKSAAMEASRKLNLRLQGAMIAAEEQAFTDTLTGLKNRRAMEHVLARHMDWGTRFGLMQIDLDWFKAVNDTLGMQQGITFCKRSRGSWSKKHGRVTLWHALAVMNLSSFCLMRKTATLWRASGAASSNDCRNQFHFRARFVESLPVSAPPFSIQNQNNLLPK